MEKVLSRLRQPLIQMFSLSLQAGQGKPCLVEKNRWVIYSIWK